MFKQNTSVNKTLSNVDVDLDLILCSLFTLAPSNELFKNINLKNDIYCINGESYLLSNKENFKDLYNLLNESYLRQFAYNLLEPFRTTEPLVSNPLTKSGSLDDQTILLQKYLRKFNYIYNRYFLTKNDNYNLSPTDKEINYFAIKSLFLLIGI